MAIYKGGNALKIYKGSYKPVNWYKGAQKVAGWKHETQTGESASFADTYDDTAEVSVAGNSEQAVTVQGKNLFDMEKWFAGDFVEIDGEYNNILDFYNLYGNIKYMQGMFLPGVRYTLTQTTKSPIGHNKRLQFVYTDGTGSGGVISTGEYNTVTTISSAEKSIDYVRCVYSTAGTTTGDFYIKDVQLELGTTATSYSPFTPNSPSPDYPSAVNSAVGTLLVNSEVLSAMPLLRKIGTVADTWEPETGEVTRRIGVKVFDGTEAWINRTADGSFTICNWFQTNLSAPTLSDIGLSSHFKYTFNSLADFEHIRLIPNYALAGVIILKSRAVDVTAFKAYLAAQYAAGTPVTVYYQLATPTTESVTPVTIPTYPKTTIIEQDSTVKASITATAKVID